MKKRIKLIAIVAGGSIDQSILSSVRKANMVIGVDRGAYWLIENNIVPDIAIGDFDSVSLKEFSIIDNKSKSVQKYSPQKDETDLELAVMHVIKIKPENVEIYGALGTRFDHVWASVQMLTRLESHNIMGQIVDNFNKIYIVRHSETVYPLAGYPYISLFPLGVRAVVSLKGFRYDVDHRVFVRSSTLGVSNEIAAKSAQITVHSGATLVIRSRD